MQNRSGKVKKAVREFLAGMILVPFILFVILYELLMIHR
jgi:hypothetical protein